MITARPIRPDLVYKTGVTQPALRLDPVANARQVTNTFLPRTTTVLANFVLPEDGAEIARLPAGGAQAAAQAAKACVEGRTLKITDKASGTSATISPLGFSGTGSAGRIAAFAHKIAERVRYWFARLRGQPIYAKLPAAQQTYAPSPLNNKASVAAQIVPAPSASVPSPSQLPSDIIRTAVEPYLPPSTWEDPTYDEPAVTVTSYPRAIPPAAAPGAGGALPSDVVMLPAPPIFAPPPPPRIARPEPPPPPPPAPVIAKTSYTVVGSRIQRTGVKEM